MIKPELEYQPKGGMCRTCVNRDADCRHLPFKDMQPLGKGDSDGTVIVRCDNFKRRVNCDA